MESKLMSTQWAGDAVTDDTMALAVAITAAAGKSLLLALPLRIADPAALPPGDDVTLVFRAPGKLVMDFGEVLSVEVLDGGAGYATIPSVILSGGGGSGAAASALLGGRLATIVTTGSGYGYRELLTVQGGTTNQACVLEVTGIRGGTITSVRVFTPGRYSVLPSNPVSVTSTLSGIGGTFILDWQLVGLTVTAGGSGYMTTPTVTVTGPANRAASCRAMGRKLTWRGAIDAPATQIFGGYGAVAPFTAKVPTIYPQWWGAKADGATDDSTALQLFLDATDVGHGFMPAGTYAVARPLYPPVVGTIRGAGRNSTVIKPLATMNVFHIRSGFDLYLSNFGINDTVNVQPLNATAFLLDNSHNDIQRVFVSDVLIVGGGRVVANQPYEAKAVFGCRFERINAYIKGAFCELRYTTGLFFTDCLSEHIGVLQDGMVLRDFWFYGCDADLGGGLELIRCISRVPANYGFTVEGPGNGHCWEKFLQCWLTECSSDNSGKTGLLLTGVDQANVTGGYYALAQNNYNLLEINNCTNVKVTGTTVRSLSGVGLDGVAIIDGSIVQLVGCQIADHTDASGVSVNGTRGVLITGNTITGNWRGVFVLGASTQYTVTNNLLIGNSDAAVFDGTAHTSAIIAQNQG
jgi:parallel beta-helix repeat protein